MVGLRWLQMSLGEWFWMAVDGFGCLQMALGGLRWRSEICSFSSYGEIRCFRSKRSRQLWEWPSFWVIQNIKFHLKRPWVDERCFFLWKLTHIALCKFSRFWLRFSPFWRNFFKDLLIWLIIGWQFCILGWVSDNYSYLLKPCFNYIFKVSIVFGHFQKVINSALETSGKNQILIYPRTMKILSCKELKFSKLLYH